MIWSKEFYLQWISGAVRTFHCKYNSYGFDFLYILFDKYLNGILQTNIGLPSLRFNIAVAFFWPWSWSSASSSSFESWFLISFRAALDGGVLATWANPPNTRLIAFPFLALVLEVSLGGGSTTTGTGGGWWCCFTCFCSVFSRVFKFFSRLFSDDFVDTDLLGCFRLELRLLLLLLRCLFLIGGDFTSFSINSSSSDSEVTTGTGSTGAETIALGFRPRLGFLFLDLIGSISSRSIWSSLSWL